MQIRASCLKLKQTVTKYSSTIKYSNKIFIQNHNHLFKMMQAKYNCDIKTTLYSNYENILYQTEQYAESGTIISR